MKTIILFLVYIIIFMLFFFVLSAIGVLWGNTYYECISCRGWFAIYSVFVGWWIAIFACQSYYAEHREYFTKVFN